MQAKHHFRLPRPAMTALLGLGFCGLAALVALLGIAGFQRAPAWQLMAWRLGP